MNYKSGFTIVALLIISSFLARSGAVTCAAQILDASTPCQAPAPQRTVCQDPFNDAQDVGLDPGKPLERALAGGAAHTYVISVDAGHYLRVIVDQRGIDVLVKLVGPGLEVKIDSPTGPYGLERISAIAPPQGTSIYHVEVRAEDRQPIGCYEIRTEFMEPATTRDKKQVAGDRAFAEAVMAAQQARDMRAIQDVIDKYEEALADFRSSGDTYGEAAALSGAAFQYGLTGRADKALEYFGIVLPLWQKLNDRRREAQTLNNSGSLYLGKGDVGLALDCYLRSLPLWCATGDRVGEATARNNIASIYTEVGDHRKAIVFYQQSLEILRGIPSTEAQQAAALNNLGTSYDSLREPAKALTFHSQSLQLRRALPGGAPLAVAQSLNNMGVSHLFKGSLAEAEREFEEALEIRLNKDRQGEAASLYGIGNVHKARGKTQAALDHYKKALAIQREIHDRAREAITLHAMAGVERAMGDLGAAYRDIDDAIKIIEELRRGFTNEELRTAYLSSVQDIYQLYIDLLMQMDGQSSGKGYAAAAFKISEQARARIFLELLASARINVYEDVDSQLIQRERSLATALNSQAFRYTRILSTPHTKEQEDAVKAQIEIIKTQLEQTRALIRQASPRYAELTEPKVYGVEEIQRELLDDNTVLLEYALGMQRSFLWMVSKTSISSYVLPRRAEIERAAKRFHELLGARGDEIDGETPARRAERIARADAEATALGASLSRMLLDQVSSQLGNRRLIIVADGALQYVPFAALPLQQGRGARQEVGGLPKTRGPQSIPPKPFTATDQLQTGDTPLVVNHEIIAMPSASALAMLRHKISGRTPASKLIAVFADPVYSLDDARVKAKPGAAIEQGKQGSPQPAKGDALLDIKRAAQDFSRSQGMMRFRRLGASGWEGERIYKLAPAGKRKLELDFDASPDKVKSPELSDYQILHFSAHGLIDDVHPELSAIVLSLVDGQGQSVDGFLRLHEIYNLNLPAELVMLNACETGLGEEVQGEGMIGLTRGLMHAGAARVIVTLWPMRDRAAAEFSVRFYKKLLSQQYRSPLEAMHATQVEMITNPELRQLRAPYFWSGYTFIGIW